jgi:hypothetical protein
MVMDADDQRMRLSLALYGPIETSKTETNTANNTGTSIKVTLCLVELEEDEAEEGIPLVVRPQTDDEEFRPRDSRFAGSLVNLSKMTGPTNGETDHPNGQRAIPLGRRQLSPEGRVSFAVPVSRTGSSRFVFHHEETGLQLRLVLTAGNGASSDRGSPAIGDAANDSDNNFLFSDGDDDESSRDHEFVYGVGGNGVGDYEDDGFVVHDENVDDDEDVQSHDVCCVCGGGGELLICDGGDHLDGCRKCFHISCVGLDSVPTGEWVCSACASEEGLATEGQKGHEFPAVGGGGGASASHDSDASEDEFETNHESDNNSGSNLDSNHGGSDSENSTNGETDRTNQSRAKKAAEPRRSSSSDGRASKRRVILESDEDED